MPEIVNEVMHVELSRDKMLGVIWFMPPEAEGRTLSLEQIKAIIASKGIVKGINEALLSEIIQDKQYNYKYIIAQGKPAINGIDGEIHFNFDKEQLINFVPKEKDDGTVDFKDLGTVFNVKKGDVLATKTSPTQGSSGYNIMGTEIKPKRGKDVRMPKGKNTEVVGELTLVAAVDGKLEYDGYNAYVNTVYTVPGDVDSSIGNINFVGSIIVKGIVHSGFTIQAEGSIEIQGPVEDAIIIAGGDVFLSYGIQGTNKSKIVAGGNVITKFIQNAHVEAKGDVITEAIIHSTVSAGNNIRAEIGKGTIVGGSVAATNMILARSLGSPMGTVTSVQIGVLPEVYQEHRNLADSIKTKQEDLVKVEQSIAFLNTKAREGNLDVNKKVMLSRLNLSKQPLEEELVILRQKFKVLSEKLREAQNGVIKASEALYPGVKITLGNMVKYIDETRMATIIRKVDGDISIS